MNTKTQLSLAAALSLLSMACEQPAPKCTIARGIFAATYTRVSGSGDCAALKGDALYVQAYSAQTSKSDKAPNYDETSIAIQPGFTLGLLGNAAGAMVEPNPKDKPYAYGTFDAAEPDADDFCVANDLSPARVRLPVAPAWEMPDPEDTTGMAPPITNPEQPAIDLQYAFSNVRVYTTAAAVGTQFAADLTLTQDGCTAKYEVAALYPYVACAKDADCSAEPDASDGRPLGSGINPDFSVRCDPDLMVCVPKKAPPSLR